MHKSDKLLFSALALAGLSFVAIVASLLFKPSPHATVSQTPIANGAHKPDTLPPAAAPLRLPASFSETEAEKKKRLAKAEQESKAAARRAVAEKKRMAELQAKAKRESQRQLEEARREAELKARTFHDAFFLKSQTTDADENSAYVLGEIQNVSSHTYSYVQVEIGLFDESKALVGSTMDNVNNLEPGQIWKFRALITDDRATKYKVKDVTGW